MIVVIAEFVEEWPWLKNEGRKHDLGQIHAGAHLFDQGPDDGFVLVGYFFGLRGISLLKGKMYIVVMRCSLTVLFKRCIWNRQNVSLQYNMPLIMNILSHF